MGLACRLCCFGAFPVSLRPLTVCFLIITFIGTTVCVLADPGTNPTPQPKAVASPKPGTLGSQFNIDSRLDMAAEALARRYNLTPEQDRTARDLLRTSVYSLLEKHEEDVRKLLGEIMAVQFTGKPPTAQQVQGWAERTQPIYDDIKTEIIQGNDALHQTMNDEQKKQHDTDMAETRQAFGLFEDKLTRWQKGGFTPDDWYPNRQRSTTQNADDSAPAATARGPEHFWAIYTRNFIRDHELDQAQTASANSILSELSGRAEKMRASRSVELKNLEDKLNQLLSATPPDSAALQKVLAQRRDLMKPINDLFKELKDRLGKLPNAAQNEKFEQKMKDRAAAINRANQGTPPSSPSTSAGEKPQE